MDGYAKSVRLKRAAMRTRSEDIGMRDEIEDRVGEESQSEEFDAEEPTVSSVAFYMQPKADLNIDSVHSGHCEVQCAHTGMAHRTGS